MSKKAKTSIDIPLSLRWLGLAPATLASITNLVIRRGVRSGPGRLRHWGDAQRLPAGKIVSGEALRLFAAYGDPQVVGSHPVDVPAEALG